MNTPVIYESKNKLCVRQQFLSNCFNLTQGEWKILLTLYASLQTDSEIDTRKRYQVDIGTFRELMPQESRHSVYNYCVRSGRGLMRKLMVFNVGDKRIEANYLQDIAYNNEEQTVDFRITEYLGEMFSLIRDNYSIIDLLVVLRFTHNYSYNFYLWFYEMSFQNNQDKTRYGTIQASIEEIRERLQLDKKYPNTKDFMKRVINPAIDELSRISDLDVDMSIKRGRHKIIKHIEFQFRTKPEKELKKLDYCFSEDKAKETKDSINESLNALRLPNYKPTAPRFANVTDSELKKALEMCRTKTGSLPSWFGQWDYYQGERHIRNELMNRKNLREKHKDAD